MARRGRVRKSERARIGMQSIGESIRATMASFDHSVVTSLPLNVVNDVYFNRAEWSYGSDELNERFRLGQRLDLSRMDFSQVTSAHEPVEPVFSGEDGPSAELFAAWGQERGEWLRRVDDLTGRLPPSTRRSCGWSGRALRGRRGPDGTPTRWISLRSPGGNFWRIATRNSKRRFWLGARPPRSPNGSPQTASIIRLPISAGSRVEERRSSRRRVGPSDSFFQASASATIARLVAQGDLASIRISPSFLAHQN